MASQVQELEAMLRELEAQLGSAPREMQAILRQQIESTKSTISLYRRAEPELEQNRKQRTPLAPHLVEFFTPELAAAEDHGVGCAISMGAGRIPIAHGLGLSFYASSGTLASQRFYEHGCLRWSIEYHALGGRSSVGFYVSTEPKTYPEHGLHTSYAPNGTVVSQTWHDNGVKHGWQKLWEDDGLAIVATLYDRGREVESVLPDGTHRTA
jgi:hypothetical protein